MLLPRTKIEDHDFHYRGIWVPLNEGGVYLTAPIQFNVKLYAIVFADIAKLAPTIEYVETRDPGYRGARADAFLVLNDQKRPRGQEAIAALGPNEGRMILPEIRTAGTEVAFEYGAARADALVKSGAKFLPLLCLAEDAERIQKMIGVADRKPMDAIELVIPEGVRAQLVRAYQANL